MISIEVRQDPNTGTWQGNCIPYQERPLYYWSVANLPDEQSAWCEAFDMALLWCHTLSTRHWSGV